MRRAFGFLGKSTLLVSGVGAIYVAADAERRRKAGQVTEGISRFTRSSIVGVRVLYDYHTTLKDFDDDPQRFVSSSCRKAERQGGCVCVCSCSGCKCCGLACSFLFGLLPLLCLCSTILPHCFFCCPHSLTIPSPPLRLQKDEEYKALKSQVDQRSADALLELCKHHGGLYTKVRDRGQVLQQQQQQQEALLQLMQQQLQEEQQLQLMQLKQHRQTLPCFSPSSLPLLPLPSTLALP